jgi:type II secretory pathway component PulF
VQVFAYTAVTDTGSRTSGTLRSQDRREALAQIVSRGMHPLLVEAVADGGLPKRSWRSPFRRVKTQELAVFARQLAALLKAGLPVVQALSTLREQSQSKVLKAVLEDIEDTLHQEGGTLADVMGKHPKVFSAVFQGLVRAGEEGGNLVEVLSNLAKYLGNSAKLRRQVVAAFVYPAFIMLMGITAVFFLMTFVIPRFQELFLSFGQQLPWPTRMLLAVSGFLGRWWYLVLVGFGAAALLLVGIFRRPAVRLRTDRAVLRLPVFGQLLLKMEIARICRTLGTLLESGVEILESIRVTGQAVANRFVGQTFPQLLKAVAGGEPLAAAIEKPGIFPPMLVNLVRTGEETGELPAMLSELADIYEDETERAVGGAVKLVEPLLIVIIGGAVAAIVAAIMLPVFEINTMVG